MHCSNFILINNKIIGVYKWHGICIASFITKSLLNLYLNKMVVKKLSQKWFRFILYNFVLHSN